MKVLVRGDCCSRRMIMFNRIKFDSSITIVSNEKAPNAVFVDYLNGLQPNVEFIERFINPDAMGKSQRFYFYRQFERNVLDECGAALIVLDPYSEMNFGLWRHKEFGWRFWVPPHTIVDEEGFNEAFEGGGYQTMEASLSNTITVLRHVRDNNPNAPILFLPQPLDYYPKLKERECFNDLGEELVNLIDNCFSGKRIPYDNLVPEDLGTGGGPNFTLHFSGASYWAMMEKPLRGGLLSKVKDAHERILNSEIDEPSIDAEILKLSLLPKTETCTDACANFTNQVRSNLQQYFRITDPSFERSRELIYRSALIDLHQYRDYYEYEAVVKKSGKGARIRQRNKARRQGYYCKSFHWRMHIPDIHEINYSSPVRSGGLMRPSYQRSVEEMGGAPSRKYEAAIPPCHFHWTYPWGVFVEKQGHMQGSVVTNEKLVGYIFLRRFGEFVLYSQILGHAGHLKEGIMVLLHHELIRWLLDSHEDIVSSLKAVMYAGFDQGNEGLREWKRREAFEPFLVQIDDIL